MKYFILSLHITKWCRPEDLNPQPTDYKSVALPIELGRLFHIMSYKETIYIVSLYEERVFYDI